MWTRAQVGLVAHCLALPAAMLVLVPWLTTQLGAHLGYLAVLLVYWLGFCLPVVVTHVRNRHEPGLFSERLRWRDWWVPLLLLAQVGMIAAVAFFPNTGLLTSMGLALAALVAVINGPLEETAWRGSFMTRFADRPRLGMWLGWLLFTLWHAPLLLAQGIVFDGGWPALLGGSAVLGLLWSWIAWRTGSVFYVAIAHTLTNVLTFWVLFNANGFVPPQA